MDSSANRVTRVVLLYWKHSNAHQFEVFSNLKNLSASYPQFNYNTLNNYLSKAKKSFETVDVSIQRITVLNRPKPLVKERKRSIAFVVRKANIKDINDDRDDLGYWLKQPVIKRLAAVTSLGQMHKKPGQKMDRLHVKRFKMKK